MKARKVKGIVPSGPLADNAERIVRTRLDELFGFMPKAADPEEIVALHDLRIAAKRLRYILEVTGSVFGPYASTAVKHVKELQDMVGEIHDCDEQLPAVAAFMQEQMAADAAAKVAGEQPPNPSSYAGLVALQVHLRARRELLFARFLAFWSDLERKGFRPRLEYAVSERSDAAIIPEQA